MTSDFAPEVDTGPAFSVQPVEGLRFHGRRMKRQQSRRGSSSCGADVLPMLVGDGDGVFMMGSSRDRTVDSLLFFALPCALQLFLVSVGVDLAHNPRG